MCPGANPKKNDWFLRSRGLFEVTHFVICDRSGWPNQDWMPLNKSQLVGQVTQLPNLKHQDLDWARRKQMTVTTSLPRQGSFSRGPLVFCFRSESRQFRGSPHPHRTVVFFAISLRARSTLVAIRWTHAGTSALISRIPSTDRMPAYRTYHR